MIKANFKTIFPLYLDWSIYVMLRLICLGFPVAVYLCGSIWSYLLYCIYRNKCKDSFGYNDILKYEREIGKRVQILKLGLSTPKFPRNLT